MSAQDPNAAGPEVRGMLRRASAAALATRLHDSGEPYASLVLLACDWAGQPLLLLSDLAEHSRNLAAESRLSLLVDETPPGPDRLAGTRASVQGTAEIADEPALKARFVRRHPSAAGYAEFSDFHLYRVTVHRAHLVAGFGRIDWVKGADIAYPVDGCQALIDAEERIAAHMDEDHRDAMAAMAQTLQGAAAGDWRMAGVDPEGCDLIADDGRLCRVPFDKAVMDPEGCRVELVRLTRRARQAGGPG